MTRYQKQRIGMSKSDFQRVFSDNKKSVDSMLVVLARPNGLSHSRLGLAIAKKYTAGAVQRNRIKRLVRESFRQHQPFKVAVDTVVMNRTGIAMKDNSQVFQSLHRHWTRINNKLEQQGT